jgi:hypothetical protein
MLRPNGWKLTKLRVLSPEFPDWVMTPEPKDDGLFVTAALPPFRYWAIVVMDLEAPLKQYKASEGARPWPR